MSNTVNDLDLCRSLLSIIDEMYEADGITPIRPTTEAPLEAVAPGEYTYTLEYNGESSGISVHKLTITSPEGETKAVADDFTYFDDDEGEMQDQLASWFNNGHGIGDSPDGYQNDPSVEEGKLPAGLQAYQDKKNGKKDADADADEDKAKIKDAKGRYSKAVGVMKGKKDEDKEETVEEAVEELQKIMQLAGLESIDEAMSDAYGIVPADQESDSTDGSVEFKQHKSTDKGSISVEASADNMEELQKIMQLAGLSLPDLNASADDEPEQEELLVSPDDEQPADGEDGEEVVISPDNDESPCGEPAPDSDAKQTLVSIIKDKLQQRLK